MGDDRSLIARLQNKGASFERPFSFAVPHFVMSYGPLQP